MSESHKQKYASFLRLIEDSKNDKIERVVISHPSVLGDDYGEMIENLSLLAEAGLSLSIAGRA